MAFLFILGLMRYYSHNGVFLEDAASGSGYRYCNAADGLFETMRLQNGKILFEEWHMQRLHGGMKQLGYLTGQFPTDATLAAEASAISQKNNCSPATRVRLSVFRGAGNTQHSIPVYFIECYSLEQSGYPWFGEGINTGLFSHAIKSADQYSSLKSCSRLAYSEAARFAAQQKLDDCIVLNQYGAVADSSIANVFIVKDNIVYTPSLSEGCVAGVMRRYLLQCMQRAGISFKETRLYPSDLISADELFLTNAVRGIIPVMRFETKQYQTNRSQQLYATFLQTIS